MMQKMFFFFSNENEFSSPLPKSCEDQNVFKRLLFLLTLQFCFVLLLLTFYTTGQKSSQKGLDLKFSATNIGLKARNLKKETNFDWLVTCQLTSSRPSITKLLVSDWMSAASCAGTKLAYNKLILC